MKKKILLSVIIGFLIIISLYFGLLNFAARITTKSIETTSVNLELYNCTTSGWDEEYKDYKFTMCPDDKQIIKGIGIASSKDSQGGGRVYCCNAKVETYDCKEEGSWEGKDKDYEVASCPLDRPVMRGIAIKIENDDQTGGKVYCCKGKNLDLYNCAITNYWEKSGKDNELTVCPDDRQVMIGAGFNIKDDNQAGGKIYCCKGKIFLEEKTEEKKVEAGEGAKEEKQEEKIEKEEKVKESLKQKIYRFFCKIFYSDKKKCV